MPLQFNNRDLPDPLTQVEESDGQPEA